MSLDRVATFARELPPRLREDVLGYARSIQLALPEIFEDAGVADNRALRDQLVLLAGIKKLHAICSSAFWILDNSLAGLQEANVEQVRIGGLYVSRGSREWFQLREAVTAIEAILADQRLQGFIHTTSYAQILTELADGR